MNRTALAARTHARSHVSDNTRVSNSKIKQTIKKTALTIEVSTVIGRTQRYGQRNGDDYEMCQRTSQQSTAVRHHIMTDEVQDLQRNEYFIYSNLITCLLILRNCNATYCTMSRDLKFISTLRGHVTLMS